MKVLILNDCGNRKTSTLEFLKGICDGLAAPHTMEWVRIAALNMQPCYHCKKCLPFGECALPEDDAHKVGRAIFSADALVIGLQGSASAISSPFRTLLDRCRTIMAYRSPCGQIRPWRSGRVAAVASEGRSECLGNGPLARAEDIPEILEDALHNGGFRLLNTLVDGAGTCPWPSLLSMERARALGSSLSCVLADRQQADGHGKSNRSA